MKSVIIGTRVEKRDEDHDSEVMNMILMMLLMMMVVMMMMMMMMRRRKRRRRRRSMRIGAADHGDKGKEEEEGKNAQDTVELQLEHPSSGDIPRSTDTMMIRSTHIDTNPL